MRASYQLSLNDDLIVDNFAGGGGASQAIEAALNRAVDVAINHDPAAIAMHTANHRGSIHLCQDVFEVVPREVTRGRRILAAHFSPDCKHFSKAKGGAPVDRKIRDLAWVVHRWTSLPENEKPLVVTLENVEEFVSWGPVVDGKPCPERKGQTFHAFIKAFRRHGYEVEWRELRACDFGAPTIRKRLFLIARCDGRPIVWPTPTHADPKKIPKGSPLKPWRTAAECIDWSIPCPSIFSRKRPLAENTLKRVAKGFRRFVVEAEKPFIVMCNHAGDHFRGQDIDRPLNTFCPKDANGVVVPYLTEHANASNPRVFAADEPLRTQCANVKGGHFAYVGANLVGVGGRAGQSRPRGADEPMATLTTKADTAIVAPSMIQIGYGERTAHYKCLACDTTFKDPHATGVGGLAPAECPDCGEEINIREIKPQEVRALDMHKPLGTITAGGNKFALTSAYLVAASITKMRGTNTGHAADEPLHTLSAGGTHHAVTTAYMVKYYGNEKEGQDVQKPLGTVTVKDRFALIAVDSLFPPELTEEQRYNAWWVTRFLEDYGVIPHFDTLTPRPAFLMLGDFIVYDIGMRMLIPAELARAQGFYGYYVIDYGLEKQPNGVMVTRALTKTEQVRMIGNSVSPPPLEAIYRENVLPILLLQPTNTSTVRRRNTKQSDKRVSDLLEANNRYLQRARDAWHARTELREKVEDMRVIPRAETDPYYHGINDTVDAVLKLIDGGE